MGPETKDSYGWTHGTQYHGHGSISPRFGDGVGGGVWIHFAEVQRGQGGGVEPDTKDSYIWTHGTPHRGLGGGGVDGRTDKQAQTSLPLQLL